MPSNKTNKLILFFIFSISGFTGLIYESIWSHYLKLILGHAAHAQTLVLAIFMGGMALGAWLVSKRSKKITNPILCYAAIELLIGVLAIFFHSLFIYAQQLLYNNILPVIPSAEGITATRWLLAAMLILPQSILLGATFPLMSAGIVRLFPQKTGSILAMLYFTNSFGAALGVLVSGFILIDALGLPGTILTAGLLNIALALIVWALNKVHPFSKPPMQADRAPEKTGNSALVLLLAAALTGLASFLYEIGWIRMLNLVLGTSVQSFELMLSAFIAGIAFGGLWIKKRIDNIKNVIRFAGYVQLIMGLFAIATVPLYNSTFDFMQFIMAGLQRSEQGYHLFLLGSHLIAFAIMLPATFMAGMTLPLFTNAYIRSGHGEIGIGRIYAANTIGSIIGILLAVHWVMPLLGLENLIALGSLVDIVLGIVLLQLACNRGKIIAYTAGISALGILLITVFSSTLDQHKMASGVYRNGVLSVDSKILFHKDGKTATVVVDERTQEKKDPGTENKKIKTRAILTNGKPDASVLFDDVAFTGDQPTMVLAALYPLAVHPTAQNAAVIGIGSGITSNTLLKTSRLKTVDTIEIEQAMVDGARYFEAYSERVYSDPRSQIHIDDAKAFFATHNTRYDLIISEPSNPWVSGVASLFTEEFYAHIKRYLNEGGVLTQWLQAYEIDTALIASIFNALGKQFKYYLAYRSGTADIIVLAADNKRIFQFNPWLFKEPALQDTLAKLQIQNTSDLYARRIASNTVLDPFFATENSGVQPNSDFFPLVSRHAPKTRFLNRNAFEFLQLPYTVLPVMDFIDPLPEHASRFNLTQSDTFTVAKNQQAANAIIDHLYRKKPIETSTWPWPFSMALRDLKLFEQCSAMDTLDGSLLVLAELINAYLPAATATAFWQRLKQHRCYEALALSSRLFLELYYGVAMRDSALIKAAITAISAQKGSTDSLAARKEAYLHIAALTMLATEKDNKDTMKKAMLEPEGPSSLLARLLQAVHTNNNRHKPTK